MGENQTNIRDFESLLQRYSTRTSAGIYGDGSNQKNCPNNLFTPKDVITNVAQTIRAIQNADCIKLYRNARKKLAPYKCSQFLSVNMLPNSKEEPKPPVLANRFETQCVTDTQLIDVIDKAEGLNVEPGMTQEFDTTFFLHGEADSGDGGTKGSNIEINKNQETSSKEFVVNAKEIAVKHTHEQNTTETFVCHKPKSNIQQTVDTENPSTSQINKTVQNTETPKDQPVLLTRNKTEILNDSIDIELSLENLGVLIEDTKRPASPVLKTNMQTKKPILSQHLVVDLEQFENFEKLAAQLLISERVDLNAAENLINSQILGKEIMLLPEFDKQFLEKELNSRALETKQLDHEYLEAEKCVIDEELQASQILMSKGTVPPDFNTKIKEGESPKEKPAPQDRSKKNENDAISEIEHQTKTQSSTTPVLRPTSVASEDKLEDDILFSSDEEEDYIHKEIQELPLSIALESSFYTNQSDILDRTMYVGFQTASNKSIQISIDSYAKARNAFEQVSLKDLVEKCSENVQIGKNTEDGIEDAVEQNINKISDQNEPINKNIGFKTACSKNIEISKETMLETNTVLKDLNNELSEVFENNTDIQVLPDISDNKKNKFHYLEKVRDIFKDIDLNDIFDTEMGTVQYEENIKAMASVFECPQFEGFKTASNKNINISIKALERSRKVFQDIEKIDNGGIAEVSNPKNDTLKPDSKSPTIFESLNKTTVTKEHDFKGKPEGFRRQAVMTASNEKFKISGEVLPQLNMFLGYPDIEEIHQDVALLDEFKTDCTEIATKNETKENIDSKLMETVQNPAFVGFKTASDKQIDISKQAMTKTMGIFKEIDSVNTTSMKDLMDGSESEEFGVFKTSSNKSITISSDPLARTKSVFSKNVFQDIDNIKTFSSIEYVEDNAMPTFIGFQTASKKPVVISKDSIEKSKSILEDIDKMSSEKPETCKERVLHGFQTARRKPVAITKEALEKTKYTLLQDIDQAKLPNFGQNLKSEPKLIGFQTASKKPVSISKEAFKKTKHIFQDIDQVKLPINDQNQKPEAMFIGFQTASKKPVSISNEALEKTKNIFQDIDQVKLPTDDQNQKREPTFIGFQAASKKPVSISKEALENTKNMFQDIDQVKLPTYGQTQKCEPTFRGCQTASKKPVSISKEALANTKNIFQAIDQVELPTDDQNKKCEPTFIGFQTASKKPVAISKEALEKTKNIFQDINESNDILREVLKHKSEQQFAGFKTASKKPIFISKEALEKTNSLFRDIQKDDGIEQFQDIKRASNKNVDICKESIEKTTKWFEELADLRGDSKVNRDYLTRAENPVVKRDNSGNICGFQTASNRAVKISAEALAKTKNIFQDIDLDHKNGEVRKFEGFQTASKKKIRISEDALAKTKNIFDNIENNEVISPKKTNLLGFLTASKKKVEISEDALAKTKDIFKDIELIEKTKPQHPNNNVTRKCNENSFHYKNVLAKIADVKHVKTNSPPKNLVQHKHCSEVKEIELDKIINTQVLQNFEEALNTEDFFPKSPEINRKRSGSPILSCPKAKKRKCFKTPYKITLKIDKPVEASPKSSAKPNNSFKFDVNYKKQKYYTLKIIQQLEKDSKEKAYIDPHITSFKFDDLLQFQFSGDRNNLTTKEILSVEELKNYFEESVDSKIIPIGWFENHVKLILWKLISYEIKFPRTMSNTCNAKTVIDQLKYRYDRELYRVERPALRKILERDDVSTRTIVLCVVSIFADGDNVSSVTNANTTIELLLTDGWYCVQACTDKMLTRLVCERKIFVGCKLMTHGAELLNCEQGVAPWEDTSKVRLKLAGNSTRRARWDQRLGYHGNAAILSPLPTVCPDGGKVAKTRVFVARVYPLLYVEKFEDGSTVTRSERLEQIYQMKYESDRQIQLEKLYEDAERELSDVESQDSDPDLGGGKRRCPDSGSQIAKLMRRSKDPQEFRSTLTDSQNRLLADHTAKTRERLLQDIQARVQERLARTGLNMTRNVVALLKIRVAGAWEKRGELIVTKGLMSIWRPNDAILEILQEGAWIDVMDVAPTALRYSELQLSAGRQSTFDKAKVKQTEKTKALAKSLVRTCSSIKDLTRNPNSKHDYNEIDTVGMVFEIEPGKEEFEKESIKNHHPFQNVYITDPEKNLLCINFWGGLKKFGFENILDTGQVIVSTNLQKRAGNTRKSIPQFRATEFTYFTKTPRNKTARDMAEEMVKTFLGLDRRKFCQDCIEKKNNMASVKYQSNTETISPYRFNNSDYNLSRNKIYIESPLVQKALQRKDDDLNLTGLDFESTFKHKETQDLSPEELKRKQRVQQKMAKLRMYGDPPPISPIHITNKSVHACNEYKSPLVTKPQESPKTTVYDRNYQNGVGVARLPIESLQSSVEKSGERNCTNITSPMIIMNRTYVKNVNPVKLNFSDSQGVEENNVCVDHFAEEFDDSPPLSLD